MYVGMSLVFHQTDGQPAGFRFLVPGRVCVWIAFRPDKDMILSVRSAEDGFFQPVLNSSWNDMQSFRVDSNDTTARDRADLVFRNPCILQGTSANCIAYFHPLHRSSSVQNRTMLSHPTRSPSRSSAATSTLSGDSGRGSVSSCWIADMVDDSVYTGLQCSVVRRVRQISPVVKEMLGWEMRVVKRIEGGERG